MGAIAFHVEDAANTVFKYATFAAIFHLINHATFKGSLFMVAGIVDHETGTRDIRKLGGLMSVMPITFTVALIGSLSMAGVPPFNGFLSKEMFLTAVLAVKDFELFNFATWGILFPIVAWVASVFTFIYSFYFVFKTFTGKLKKEELPHAPHEAPIGMLISPILLATLVVAIFFIPNLIADTFIKPAVYAIQPFLYTAPADINVHISAWHGFKPEFWMTVAIFAVGLLLFLSLAKWQKLYAMQPARLSLNSLYDYVMDVLLGSFMTGASKLYMDNTMRQYLTYMLGSISIIVIGTLYLQGGFKFNWASTAPIRVYDVILIIVLVIGTFTSLFAKSRLTAIIGLGAAGYAVALFFVLFNAPDLALTQLVIETISVALFLLAFYHLPKLNKTEERMRFHFGRATVSILVGVMVTLVAIASHSQKLVDKISTYYEETVYTLAGGGNIVNVILVDYRGFDTLFEITVLGIAGMAIYGMIKLRLSRKEKSNESK